MIRFIDKLPAFPTILVGAWMALAPFTPEPHLLQKFLMAINGLAFSMMDVFDVFMHVGFAIIGGTKAWRVFTKRAELESKQDA